MWVCVWVCVWVAGCASFTYFGQLLHSTSTPCQYNESVRQKEQHRGPTSEINTIPQKLGTLLTFETLKWNYTFATDVLIVIRDEAPLVCRAPGGQTKFCPNGEHKLLSRGPARENKMIMNYCSAYFLTIVD